VLSLSGNRIRDLDGLEFLGDLKVLRLAHNQLRDLKNLRNVPNIEEFDVGYNMLDAIRDDAFANNSHI
jgi:Leucine-rich repeat (LRR) protein